MSTRSLTVFKNENGKEIAVLYRQFDGYPEEHGKELADFLANKKIVNGINPSKNERQKIFNGMGCLTASVVSYFKKEVGNFYLHSAGTRNCGEDYIYIVTGKIGEEAKIKVLYFDGYASEYKSWLADYLKKEE